MKIIQKNVFINILMLKIISLLTYLSNGKEYFLLMYYNFI